MSAKADERPAIRLSRNVYIVGPQSTGKTTLVKALVQRLSGDVAVIYEIARHVMKEKGYSRIDVDSADMERRFSLQNDIFQAQVRKEQSLIESGIDFVSDRSAIDPLVYLMHYSGTEMLERITSTAEWRNVRERYGDAKVSLVFLLMPVEDFLIDDDVRYMAKSLDDWHSLASSFQRFLREQQISGVELGVECRDIDDRVERVIESMQAQMEGS